MNFIITIDRNVVPNGVKSNPEIPFGCFNYATFKDMDLDDIKTFLDCMKDSSTQLILDKNGEEPQAI